ncbi:alpha/beta hydrolase family protein [Streptomyces sp. ISL-11]|uniref:alpha/beta hydrolase n=1 Tax=Streptomyces sp. ISL-11 TaxID=2819174 RepID=UPI001BEA18E2|nr:alpha/beta hydrolase family protein [Streptomyces sp. ISL-11]MBT2384130.1 esterase family protein [Streptomyces sp. ISL-11]
MVHKAWWGRRGGGTRAGWALAVLALLLPVAGTQRVEAAAPAGNPAHVVREVRVDDRMLDLAVASPEIDAPSKWVRLLLPRGWSRDAERTWPTLWMLHGSGGDHRDWTDHTHIEELAARRDVIVVMPETSGCSSYSDWYNDGRWGAPAWETYLLDELRPLLERDYRAGTRRAAVAGLSMGGHGALKLAAARPGAFKAAASYSGAVSPLHQATDGGPSGPDAVKLGGLICLTDWKRVWGEPGYPFDTTDPRDLRQQWLWKRNSPVERAASLAGTALYLSYGNGTDEGPRWKWGDPPPPASRCTDPATPGMELIERLIHGENRQLRAALTRHGIPATVCAHTGVHTWPYWERELSASFPMLMGAIGG